jgi:integrase/recombinase XerD
VDTRKQHLAAIRHYFDSLVMRHAVLLNPALSVRGDRYQVVRTRHQRLPLTAHASY